LCYPFCLWDIKLIKFNCQIYNLQPVVELPFCVVGGPKGHKQIQLTREKIVLEITMGNCKMNYGNDKKKKKEKRQIKKK